jgi:hypothetical protein
MTSPAAVQDLRSEKIGKSGFDTHQYTDLINSDFQKFDFLYQSQQINCHKKAQKPSIAAEPMVNFQVGLILRISSLF